MILVQRAATPDYSSSDRAQAANHFRGQCPIPCPVVPVLSRCVGAGTPAVDRRPPFDLGRCVVVFRVPSSKEEPRESIPRSVLRSVPAIPATVSDRPSSFSLCLRRARPPFAGRSVLVVALRWCVVFHSQGPREEPPAKQSFPRSVSAPVPDRPGSFRLCWAGHARRSVLVVVLLCAILKGGVPPQINSEVSVRYRTRSSRFFPACSVLTSSQGRSPRQINFEVSVRYLTRSSRFCPAVLGRVRPLFGLGHCAGMFRSQGRSPANRFRGQCPLYPLPYPIVPVLSRCVGAGTPAVRSWSLCCRVPFSREEPPANQFRGQCPLPYRIVPVLSRCAMRCGSPSVRVATTLWCAFRATTASQLHHQLRP